MKSLRTHANRSDNELISCKNCFHVHFPVLSFIVAEPAVPWHPESVSSSSVSNHFVSVYIFIPINSCP